MNRTIPMNFDWTYHPDFKEEFLEGQIPENELVSVDIPHTNIELPFNNFDEKDYQFVSFYKKTFEGVELEEDQRLFICFEGVMAYAKVYLNGIELGQHKGGYTGFEFDMTDTMIQGQENTLYVVVDSNEREDIPPFGHVIDYLTYGGIYREVNLEVRHECSIQNLFIKTEDVLNRPGLDLSFDLKTLNCTVDSVKVDLYQESEHRENKVVLIDQSYPLNLNDKNQFNVKIDTPGVALWSPEKPHLYSLKVRLYQSGQCIDEVNQSIGYRHFEFSRNGFYLNGEKYKMIGLNRHQSYPYVGYAMPKSAQVQDALILKNDLGVNTVRLSHYPQSRHFLDACDELGLLVFYELPGWQHIGGDEWKEVALVTIEEMILRDRNRPSIFIWGTRINESQDDTSFYTATEQLAKDLDSTRSTGGVRCIKNSELLEDVYTFNDFSHTGPNPGLEPPKKVFKEKAPYMVTEFNGHMFPTKKFDQEAKRVEHAKRHLRVLDAAYGNDEISGAIGWCMFDYNTHKDFGSGDKICYHGVMDMFRIPKYAAASYAMQQEDTPVLEVLSDFNIGEYDGGFLTEIYCLTNCDSIKFYASDEFIGDFYPVKDKYRNLPNRPIIINDFIGNRIHENENFSPKDADIIKKLLIKANQTGGHLSIIDKVQLGILFIKYKMNFLDAENLYTKYFGGWGSESTVYKIVGIKDGQVVKTITKGQLQEPKVEVIPDQTQLIVEETYDVTRLVVTLTDDYGNTLPYANDAFTVEVEGNLELIGPSVLSLVGGSTAFYVRSKEREGKEDSKVKIHSQRFGTKIVELKVRGVSYDNNR